MGLLFSVAEAVPEKPLHSFPATLIQGREDCSVAELIGCRGDSWTVAQAEEAFPVAVDRRSRCRKDFLDLGSGALAVAPLLPCLPRDQLLLWVQLKMLSINRIILLGGGGGGRNK